MPTVVVIVLLMVASGTDRQAAGDRAYAEGRFDVARENYRSAWRSGVPVDQLAPQLGNACYVLGRTAEALYFYRLAQVGRPRAASLASSVRLVRAALGRPPRPPAGLLGTLASVLRLVTVAEALVAGYGAAIGLGVLVAIGALTRGRSAPLRGALRWAGRALVVVVVATLLVGLVQVTAAPGVVVSESGAALLERAGGGRIVARLGPGTEGRLLETVAGWSHVDCGGSGDGWVRADLLWRLPRHDLEVPRIEDGPAGG